MCSPLPLRLCCMAAMAPALTEAATQTRGKLTSTPPEPHNPTLVNGRDCATPQSDVKDRIVGRSSPKTNGISNSQPNLASLISRKDLVSSRLVSLAGAVNPSGLVNLGTIPNLSDIYKQHNQKLSPHLQTVVNQAGRNLKVNSSQSSVNCAMNNSEVTMPNKSGVISFISNISNSISSSKQLATATAPQTQEQTAKTGVSSAISSTTTTKSGPHIENENVASNINIVSTTPVTTSVTISNSKTGIKTEPMPEFTTASIDLATRKQRDLVRRSERLERRLRRLQARQSNSHVQQQLSGFVDSQHETLQSLARSIRVPSNTTDLKTELLQCEDVKNLSTAALVNLVRKVQSSQAITLRQRLTSTAIQQPEPNSILKLDADLSSELGSVSGQLASNLHHVERALDSDATESSSGGESADEGDGMTDWGSRYTHQLPLHRRAEWKWSLDRAAVASRWTWLQAQVSDLEYRIRQQSDIYRQIRATKGAVVLGEQALPEDLLTARSKPSSRNASTGRKLSPIEAKIASIEKKNEMSPCNLSTMLNNVDLQSSKLTQSLGGLTPQSSPVVNNALNSSKGHFQTPSKPINGFIDTASEPVGQNKEDHAESGDPLSKKQKADSLFIPGETACLDSTCQAARCRPARSYRKRKLLRTAGLHQFSRKAARLATVKCQCHPPHSSCAMCGGRYNNTQPLDAESMSLHDRVALLDSAYHPVLSFSQEIPLPVHFEALLKTGEWQTKQAPPSKPSKSQSSERKRSSGEPVRKYNKKVPRNASVSLLSTANKLRSRLLAEGKQLSRGHSGSLPSTPTGRNNSRASMSERLVRSSDFKIKKRSAALRSIGSSLQKKAGGRGLKSSSAAPSPTMLDMPSPISHSCSSSTLREMKDAMKRRRGESAFDINNIVIPYSMAASTRVEKLQYKEIQTPKWRLIHVMEAEEPEEKITKPLEVEKEVKVVPGNNGVISCPVVEEVLDAVEAAEDEESEDEEEDLCDSVIAARHLRCEILEKKRFITYTNQQKRNRHSRTDSGTLTPDPTTPDLVASDALSLKIASATGDLDDQKALTVSVSSPLENSSGLTAAGKLRTDSESAGKLTTESVLITLEKEDAPSPKWSRPQTPLMDAPSSTPVNLSSDHHASNDVSRSVSSTNLEVLADEKQASMRRTMSCAAQLAALSEERMDEVKEGKALSVCDDTPISRSRSGSISKFHCRDRSNSIGEDRSKNCTPDLVEVKEVPPWEKRMFPLTEDNYEQMKLESVTPTKRRQPSGYEKPEIVSTSTPVAVKSSVMFEASTPASSNPCSPLPSSSSSSILDDDPNDPEWTVIQPERKPGIVLKLTKR